ncbi:MAG: LPS export ABC transporter periplasmic protein LptC [Thiomicrorhabdus sp.]|nr:LPS export ABC transporter periplasmic protein LptC [Thiomicrorhabdus sp.]MCF6298925.1 LPS export ABC transporter periplasmic protein LptC [Thiomicrorhabdus sp.]
MRLSTLRITLFTLTLGLVALWMINQTDQATPPPTTTDDASALYHWSTTQSTTWEFSRDQPQKQHTIKTATWHYNKTTQLSQFTQPIITLTTPTTVTIIRSQTGKTVNDEAIQLSGDVKITQYQITDDNTLSPSAPSTLHTQNLTYNASQAELLSRDTITLTQAGSVTTGIGLHANLENGQFQLMSNVQSTYQANTINASSAP